MHVLNIVDINLVKYFLQKSYLYLDVSHTFIDPSKTSMCDTIQKEKPDLVLFQYQYFNHDIAALLKEVNECARGIKIIILYFENDNSAFPEFRDSYESDSITVVNRLSLTSCLKQLQKAYALAIDQKEDPKKFKILFAEKSPLLRLYVEKVLRNSPYLILEAGDGNEAYRLLGEQKPDMVIADQDLPVIDGIELCRKIKQENRGEYIPVLLLVEENEPVDEKTFFAAGVDDFLRKPLTSDMVISIIENFFYFKGKPHLGKVLVFGEDPICRQLLYHRFVMDTMSVYEASGEKEALELIELEQPDVIVFEVNPISTDYEKILQKVRDIQKGSLANVILITPGHPTKTAIRKKREVSAGDDIRHHFYKPFKVVDITALAAKMIMEKIHVYKEDFKNLLSTIKTLVFTTEAKNPFTRGHTEKVVELSLKLGTFLGFSPLELEELEVGATLHDVGKIGVRDDLIGKPNKLTRDEFEQIQEHTVIGAQILKPITKLQAIIPYILFHHERWDGKGYPSMIKGSQIPLGVRILIIAEAFTGMTSDRPYRKGMALEMALGIIKENLGKQFCPSTGKAFLQMMKKME